MKPNRDGGDALFSLVLAVVALLPRVFVAIAWAREPVWDGHYYHFGADRIAHGLGYSEDVMVAGHLLWKPWCHYPVGYSAFLALFYKLFGSGLLVAPIVNAVTGTALAVAVHRLARHYLTPTRARIAGGLTALHPGLIAYSAVVMTEPLAALSLVLAALAALTWQKSWIGIAVSGLALGLAVLVRPSALAVAPLIALVQPRPIWRAALTGLAVTAIAFAVALPWTIRNCKTMDGCAFVSTNGGWNLAIGALTTTGRFTTLRAADGCPVVTGQVQQDRCWAKVGRDIIKRDPWHWIGLMPKKLGENFDHESFAIEYLREADPGSWPEDRRVAGRGLTTLFHRLLVIAASLGVIALGGYTRARRFEWATQTVLLVLVLLMGTYALVDIQHRFYWLVVAIPLIAIAPFAGRPEQGAVGRYLVGLVAATSLVHAVFFGDDRYHLVVTPALCLLAAAALRSPGKSRTAVDPD